MSDCMSGTCRFRDERCANANACLDTYCIEGCGRPVVAQRFGGADRDGDEIVELLCYEHAAQGQL